MFDTHLNIITSKAFKLSTTILIGLFSLIFNSTAMSQEVPHRDIFHQDKTVLPEAKEKRQKVQDNTKALKKAMADYHRAAQKSKERYLDQMLSLAERRQQLLSELLQLNPSAMAQDLITTKDRKGMPDDVQRLLEQEKTLEGEIEIFYEDYEDRSKSRLRHILKTTDGLVELHGDHQSNINSVHSGEKVQVRGWKFNKANETSDSLIMTNELDGLSILAQDGSGTVETSTASTTVLSNTTGEQRTLVLLVNFQDNRQQPWTIDEVQEMVFGKVSNFYKENSFGQTWLSGDVHGYNTLPIDSSTCNSGDIDRYARQAAEDDGINLSDYHRLVFLFPQVSSCGWSGKGTLGGTQSRAWINGSFTVNTIGHELGHNFGLHHAKKLDCGLDTIGDNCISVTYGDTMDIMGEEGVEGHFGAHNKELLGWLSSDSNEIVIVESSGSYLLEPYESVPSGASKALKIKRGTDSATGEPLWYYLEYRQPLGFDKFLDGKVGITNGIVFRLAKGDDILSNQLLDMTPSSAFRDMEDSSLSVGNSYTDIDAGITMTTEWANSSGASVHVSFTEPSCGLSNPEIMVSAKQSEEVTAGNTVGYDVTVTNNDSVDCSASDYDISTTIPANWSATDSTLSIEPGLSQTVTINVTSPEVADAGVYDVIFTAVNNVNSEYNASFASSYVVKVPTEACVMVNPALLISANQRGELDPGTTASYTATVTNQDNSSCATATFDVIADVPDGWGTEGGSVTLAPGESNSVELNVTSPNTTAAGSYIFDVYAFNTVDMGYNVLTESSYTVAETAQVCELLAPMLSVSSNNIDVAAGNTIDYSVTITNQNSIDCAARDYVLSAELPNGWKGTSRRITLNSSESQTIQLSVTSDSLASDGSYNITIHAQDLADNNLMSSSGVSYIIANPVNHAPVLEDDNITLSAKDATLISVLSNDNDPEGDELTITAVTQGSKGSVEMTAGNQLLYTPAKNFKGNDSFSYTVSDGVLTTTATVFITMESSSGPNGNKGKGKK